MRRRAAVRWSAGAVAALAAFVLLLPVGLPPAPGPFAAGDSRTATVSTLTSTAFSPARPATASASVPVYASAARTIVLRNATTLPGIQASANCPMPSEVWVTDSAVAVSCGFNFQAIELLDPTTLALESRLDLYGAALFSGAFGYDNVTNCLYLGQLNWSSGLPRGNVTILNLTTGTVDAVLPASTEPQLFAFDSRDQRMFAAIPLLGYLAVINTSSRQPVVTLPGYGPISAMAFDPAQDELFIANSSSSSVLAVNASTLFPLGTVALASPADGLAVDPTAGRLYAAEGAQANITVAETSNLSVLSTVPVGQGPAGLTLDPGSHRLFVANARSQNVSVLNTSTLQPDGSLGAGLAPGALAFDARTGLVYLTDAQSENITAFNSSGLGPGLSVRLGAYPGPALFDPVSRELVVADDNRETLDEYAAGSLGFRGSVAIPVSGGVLTTLALDPTHGTAWATYPSGVVKVNLAGPTIAANVSVPGVPSGIAYDPGTQTVDVELDNGDLCRVAESNSTVLDCTSVGTSGGAIAVDPQRDWAFVAVDANGTIPEITVVNLSGPAVVARLRTSVFPGVVAYDAARGVVDVGQGSALEVVDPADLGNATTVSTPSYPLTLASDAVDGELFGAGVSELWSLPAAPAGAGYASPDGWVGPQGLAVDAARGTLYSTDLTNGTVNVLTVGPALSGLVATPSVVNPGSPVTLDLGVVSSTGPVTVNYSGLPVDCASQNATTLQCASNASGQYNVTASVRDGSGLSTNLSASFTVRASTGGASYVVAFHETGLAGATTWQATLGAQSESGSGAELQFSVPNGSYSFTVAASGYAANRSGGSVTVAGADLTVDVGFTPTSGSTLGRLVGTVTPANASVHLGALALPTAFGRFQVNVTPGTYRLEVSAPEYSTNSSNVSVLANATTTVSVTLVPLVNGPIGPVKSTPAGASGDWPLLAALAAVGLAAVALAAYAVRRRRKIPPGGEAPADDAGPTG